MHVAIVCFPGCDVINFEIKLIFQTIPKRIHTLLFTEKTVYNDVILLHVEFRSQKNRLKITNIDNRS